MKKDLLEHTITKIWESMRYKYKNRADFTGSVFVLNINLTSKSQ
ncbi:MAG: hypothetical protein ACLSUS_01855 [Opitutales bacterium]